ncbi:MAG TPA: hypothetical protein VFS57_09920, partial [Gemmatimonadaceae bacterium]|nr:hypothetical protein [Gemmatimonadaceae bacterium]
MLILAFVFSAAAQAQQPTPTRNIPDPGVIATGQRITPAGVRTVFAGKVGGVRFGATSSEIWVAVPGAVRRLAWAENRTLARAQVDGRPGIFAVAIDPVTHAAIVSSVGRLASDLANGNRRAPQVAQLSAFHGDATGDSVPAAASSGAIGEYMIGAPAVAERAGPNGKRLAVVPLPASDALMVLDAEIGAPLHTIPVGVEPIAAVISADSRFAYVSILGGPKPNPRQRSARQCCDPRAEAVRVDGRGIAQPGSVSRIDLATGDVVRDIAVARHPTALVWDEPGARLYVADGNSDSVSVIDTRTNSVSTHIAIAPFRERNGGLAPTALALSPDHRTLYVAL